MNELGLLLSNEIGVISYINPKYVQYMLYCTFRALYCVENTAASVGSIQHHLVYIIIMSVVISTKSVNVTGRQ